MSSAADRTRAKAARLAQAGQHHATVDQEAAPPVSHVPMPVSAKPIRISLDLAPMLFDQLTLWRTQAARQLGWGRVTNAEALRVLVRRLVTDEELSAEIIADLRREGAR